ncbi:PREDICTED: uncharacterized protein LOC105449648 isoform X2 [Wasmannia auropunctata]|uniref:uncharacterized protein LOC105449648 isoform X2 n=1 Tax=Wasmannia auropunctata TaxID=64793 RepID=UPI0005EF147C|nr:PREDICTED: uncharacterized protein LOC105449648 isoform X2 [Wasmannia auropunctata]
MDISSMLEVQVKEETDVKENVTPGQDQASSATTTAVTPGISQEESNYYKLTFGNDIASVRFRRIHCTACDQHIGSAPSQAHNMFEHPVLRTLLCANCHDFYGDGTFEQGDDATDMFCRWCANGGNLYCCSYCSNTFCYKCIKRNFTSLIRKKIEADEKWKCFVCNPSDLYNARAICWALLQHVQTVTRILQHDKKMTAEEIEDKMNLDETQCCPRRSKRKRRRPESNSEEEDETYTPKVANGMQCYIKPRKPVKKAKSHSLSNGYERISKEVFMNRMPIPIRPRPTAFLSGQSFNAEPMKSTVVSHKNSVITPSESIVFSSPSVINANTSLPSRFDPNTLQQQSSVYHTSFMNSGSTTFIQTPVMNRIILPPQPQPQLAYQPQQTSSYQQSSQQRQSVPNTMVSIPNPVDKHGRPLFILPKPKEMNMTLTPNIIELDSDSDDEPSVVAQQNNNLSIERGNNMDVNVPDKVVPVALTWENSDDDAVREDQPLRVTTPTVEKNVSFSGMMLPHSRELEKLLGDTKEKVYNFFELNNAIENIEAEAQQKVKHFYSSMRDTVVQMVHINDRIVRQYHEWRRSRKTDTVASPTAKNRDALDPSQDNVDIPLDMTCVNDSDTESDDNSQIAEPSDLVCESNIIKHLLSCKKNVVHRSVGEDSEHLYVNKAVQVYDVVSRDYEKCIGYSLLTRTAHDDSKADDSVLDSPAAPDENFGRYEEQFIYYLQHIEDNGIETEDTKSLADSDETSLQKVQTDPPFTSHSSQSIDLSDQSKSCQQENNLGDNIDSVAKDGKSGKTLDNNEEIVSNSDTEIQETIVQLDDKLQQTESRETHADTMDDTMEAITSDNEINSNENDSIVNLEVTVSAGSEEDCTIIDD